MKRYFICILLTYISFTLHSQCEFNYENNVIINEVGSFILEQQDQKINDEYIELLVVGNPDNPFAPVKIRGMIVDDNNAGTTGVGNEPGHIRFANNFPDLNPGTIILIYNPEGNQVNPNNDGWNENEGVYQLPINHEMLTLREGNPFNKEGMDSYTLGSSPYRGESWNEFIPFRNKGDVAQIRSYGGKLIHSLVWYYNNNAIPYPSSSIKFPNTSLSNKSIQFIGENPAEQSNYAVSSQGTPGAPNNDINAQLIENLKNGIIFNELQLELTIIQTAKDDLANGIIQVEVIGSQNITNIWVDCTVNGTPTQVSSPTSPFLIENLSAGLYSIVVSQANGECFTLEGEIEVISEKTIEEEICEGDCITLNSDNADQDLINSSPCIKWIDENGNVISSGTEAVVCPNESQSITQYIENEDGLIQEIIYHVVTHVDMSFTIDQKIPDECPPSQIEIAIEGENIASILWGDGTTSNILIVNEGGEYDVTLTSPQGCIARPTISVSEDIFLDTDGDGICDQNDCDPYVATSGGPGTPCNDFNESTNNDQFDENCDCVGEIDPDDPCQGNDIDGDGLCDDEEEENGTSPFDPCDPDGTDSDLDGVCDNLDCDPNNASISYSIGNSCDDGNASTIGDIINGDCQCIGIPDPNSNCPGQDIDGDGICDGEDDFPEDECNDLSVSIDGDITLCKNEWATDLTAIREGGVEPYSFLWSNDAETTPIITVDLNISTDYTKSVTITDGNGCTATTSVTIIQYDEPDEDGDGYCDDEECPKTEIGEYGDFPLILGGIEIVDEPILKGTKTGSTRDGECDLVCESYITTETLNFTDVCLLELTSIKFTKSYCTQSDIGDDDAIDIILKSFSDYLNDCAQVSLKEIFLIITDEEDFEKCCDLKDDIEKEYWNNGGDGKYKAGIWIDIKPNDSGETVGELRSKFYGIDNSCNYDWGGPFGPNIIVEDPFADFVVINNSLFNNFTSTVIPNPENLNGNTPYNGLGLSDFAGLSHDVRASIEENVEIGNDVWSDAGFSYDARFIVSSANCEIIIDGEGIESEKAAQSEFEADNSSELVIWIHFDENNNALFDSKINANIDQIFKDQIKENLDFAAKQNLSAISAKAKIPEFLDNDLNGDDLWRFGPRLGVDNQLNFWGITKEIGGLCINAVKKVKTPEQVWKEKGNEEGKTSMFKMPPSIAGASDALLENNPIGGVIQLVDLGEAIITDPEVRTSMLEMVKHPLTAGTKMLSQLSDDISGANGKEIQHHVATKSSVGGIIGILFGAGKVIEFFKTTGKKTAKKLEGLEAYLSDFKGPTIDQFYEKIKTVLSSEIITLEFTKGLGEIGKPNLKALVENPYLVDVWKKYLDDFPNKLDDFYSVFKDGKLPVNSPAFFIELKKAFISAEGVIDIKISNLIEDLNLSTDVDFVKLFKNKPKNVKAWKVLLDGEVDNVFRTSKTAITKVNNYLTEYPVKTASQVSDDIKVIGYKIWRSLSKFDPKFLDYMKPFDNAINNPSGKSKVWRVMRNDQSISDPIVPKSKTGLTTTNTPYTIKGHVVNGSKPNTVTPYISSTTDKSKALQRALEDGNLKVVEIDLTKIDGKLFDLSEETVRNNLLAGNIRAINYAKSSSEFLIVLDEIPTNAYKLIN